MSTRCRTVADHGRFTADRQHIYHLYAEDRGGSSGGGDARSGAGGGFGFSCGSDEGCGLVALGCAHYLVELTEPVDDCAE